MQCHSNNNNFCLMVPFKCKIIAELVASLKTIIVLPAVCKQFQMFFATQVNAVTRF